jgi:hypothetical protein
MFAMKNLRWPLPVILALIVLCSVAQADETETGPVDRKWGLGWDSGLTARLWLGGVWELGLTAGPNDDLSNREEENYDTGRPPDWSETEESVVREDKRESGFVRFQAGRLVARRGPLALVCFSGLKYYWSDSRYSFQVDKPSNPGDSRENVRDYDSSTWTLSLGIRPSFIILDFLTIETAFGLYYSWDEFEQVERTTYPETGQVRMELDRVSGSSFRYSGWSGMGSLQFIVWF